MPTGHPSIFKAADERRAQREAEQAADPGKKFAEAFSGLGQGAEVLGEIKAQAAPQTPGTTWQAEGGPQMTVADPPPPWEVEDEKYMISDARRFIEVPTTWTLRWVNPRLLESTGWQHWSPVSAVHPQVTVKVDGMVAPDQTIRRGGATTGDILAWMYTSWVISRRKILQQETDKLTQSAVDKQQQFMLDLLRQSRYLSPDGGAIHPTHTMAEGRSLRDL